MHTLWIYRDKTSARYQSSEGYISGNRAAPQHSTTSTTIQAPKPSPAAALCAHFKLFSDKLAKHRASSAPRSSLDEKPRGLCHHGRPIQSSSFHASHDHAWPHHQPTPDDPPTPTARSCTRVQLLMSWRRHANQSQASPGSLPPPITHVCWQRALAAVSHSSPPHRIPQ